MHMLACRLVISCFIVQLVLAFKPFIYNVKNPSILFQHYVKTFGKKYASEKEKEMRMKVFIENVKEMNRMNKSLRSQFPARLGPFSDRTAAEFLSIQKSMGHYSPTRDEEHPKAAKETGMQKALKLSQRSKT